MLKQLRRIVQEVSATENLTAALQLLVRRVKGAVEADACSAFVTDEESGEYVFVATDGLNSHLIGKLRLKMGQGLVGLVGDRAEPINLDEASSHDHFLSLPGLDEERYHAFLGVPIMYQRQILGVLVVQREGARRFDESEEAFLVTLALQLAGVVAHAKATGNLNSITRKERGLPEDNAYRGTSGAPGVSIGTAVVIYPIADLEAVPDRDVESAFDEIRQFDVALKLARQEIHRIAESLATSLPAAERGLFDAYIRILDSASLIDEIKTEIEQGQWAQGALKRVIKRHVAQFEAMEDLYLRERASDLHDLGRRVLFYLQEGERDALDYPKQTILVGEQLTPADLADVPEGQLVGVATLRGSPNSHLAILARAMGIPTVVDIVGLPLAEVEGAEVILDGYYGQIYIEPSETLRHEFATMVAEEQQLDAELETLRTVPAETLDGKALSMWVNMGVISEVSRALSVGAEGVGLFRTEIPFMIRDHFPTEEEQRVLYQQVLAAYAPRPVTIRCLDIGGDKILPYFSIAEENPALGWRGIRVILDQPELFLVQVRAMMRASIGLNNMKIMLPMVSRVAEVEEALRLLHQAYEELLGEGHEVQLPPMGIMIEVPSAIYQINELLKKVDFISVGSNDLTQYLLAVDRNNSRVSALYDSLHPALLRALKIVVDSAKQHGKPVGICGEMAAEPVAVVLLLGLGFDSLSMSASRLPRVKWIIRNFTLERAESLLREIMVMDDAVEIRGHVEMVLDEAGLGGLIRAGK